MADKAKKAAAKATKQTKKAAADAVAQKEKAKKATESTAQQEKTAEKKPVHKGSENLISLADRTTDEQREIAQSGGRASGEARRRKKTASEFMEMLLDLPLSALQDKHKALLQSLGIQESDLTQMGLLMVTTMMKAQKGDMNAVKMVLMLRGQMPAEKQEITGSQGTPLMPNTIYDVSKIPHEELMALTKAAFAKEGKGTEGK